VNGGENEKRTYSFTSVNYAYLFLPWNAGRSEGDGRAGKDEYGGGGGGNLHDVGVSVLRVLYGPYEECDNIVGQTDTSRLRLRILLVGQPCIISKSAPQCVSVDPRGLWCSNCDVIAVYTSRRGNAYTFFGWL